MGNKPFSTFDEQIAILKGRGLKIEDDEIEYIKETLLKENYYNVINGYKKPFLKKDLNGNLIKPEGYIENCSFMEIYQLYKMDRKLKAILLESLLKLENYFKSSCSYYFSEQYPEEYSYLNIENYSKKPDDLHNVLGTLACLSSEIKKNNKRESDRRYIPHYIEKHDNIPLWVLVNSLTFGNISYFYSSLDESLKETIARSFGERFKKNYSSKDRFVSTDLSQVIKMANFFRNVCAHDEVLFTYKLRRPVKAKVFQKFFPNINFKGENLYDMICLLKLVLPKEDYLDLVSDIESLFRKTEPYFKSVSFSKVIELSGFNDTWKSDIGL